MVIKNKIDSTFGSTGYFTGFILIIFGALVILSWVGILLILIGAFISFSFSGLIIDKDNNRVKQFTRLFGVFDVGDWENLSEFENLIVTEDKSVHRIFSKGNRFVDSNSNSHIIYMLDATGVVRMAVMKCSLYETAIFEVTKLSKFLDMPIIDNNPDNQ
jgi:hypothetical protein